MMTKAKSPRRPSPLRRRAEARLRTKSEPGREKWPQDGERLVHELEVHQAELELQNEELRRVQVEIERSRTRYADLYDFAPVAYITLDRKGLILEANLKAAELLGLPRGKLLKTPFSLYLAQPSRDIFTDTCRQAIQSPGKQACELRLIRKDGTPFWALAESIGAEDEQGKITLIRCLFWDITERKIREEEIRRLNAELERKVLGRTSELQVLNREMESRKGELEAQVSELRWTQERLARSEELFRVALKGSPITVFNQDENLRYTWVFNLPPEMKDQVVVGKTDGEIFPSEEAALLEEIKGRVLETGQGTRREVSVSFNGTLRHLDLTVEPRYDPGGGISGITCAAMDISDRKELEAEKALVERNRLLQAFFDSTITPLVFLDRDFNFLRVNEAYAHACGRAPSDFPGHNHFEFYPHEETEEIFRKVVETKVPYRVFARPFTFPDHPEWGETYWDWTLTPLLDPMGEVDSLVFSLNDVSEEARAREKMRQNEELLRTVMDLLPAGVCIFDREGNIRQINPAGRRIRGDAEQESAKPYRLGKGRWPDMGQSAGPEEGAPARAIRKGESSLKEEIEIESFDGIRKILLASTVPLHDDRKEISGAVSVFEDITDRKQVEALSRHRQKMEALGTLAGGIAHDLNNMLNPIVINTELALWDIKQQTLPSPKYLQLVLQSAERGRNLVKQIITFSRQKGLTRMQVEIMPLIREGLIFLRAALPQNIEIRQNLEAQGASVLADPTQIQQVLMNLTSNAVHAMREKGGTLGVSLEIVDVDPQTAAGMVEMKPGPYFCLMVSDTGHGMDKETLEKVFDPFFTTKHPGEGSGMGLSIVHGIVQRHGGAISISSELGKGTSVRVFLPVMKDPPKFKPEE
jgi:PAS domain S-box-containing protein